MKQCIKNIIQIISLIIILFTDNLFAQWNSLTGPIQDGITCIEQNKKNNNDNTIYIGTSSGLYISRDACNSWLKINIMNNWVTAICVNQTNVFVSTREFNGKGSNSIYRSTDDGVSWQQISLETTRNMISDGVNIYKYGDSGLYISSDNGNTWIQSTLKENAVTAFSIYKSKQIAVCSYKIYLSDDGGHSWNIVGDPINVGVGLCHVVINDSKIFISTVGSILVSSNNGASWYQRGPNILSDALINYRDTLFSVVYGDGIYCSRDNGEQWEKLSLIDNSLGNICTDGKVTVAGSINGDVYISNDLGKNWQSKNSSPQYDYVSSISFNQSNLFAASNKNYIFSSVDNGQSWNKVGQEIIKELTNCISVSGSKIYVGAGYAFIGQRTSSNRGTIYFSSDNGNTWAQLGLEQMAVHCVFVDGDNIYAGVAFYGIYYSNDNGIHWNKNTLENNVVSSFLKIQSYILTGTNGGLFISSDNGLNWSKVSNIPTSCLASDGKSIYLGNSTGVYISDDVGKTFTQIGINSTISIVLQDHSIFISGYDGVFQSTNQGMIWKKVVTGNKDLPRIIIKDNYILGFGGSMGIYSAPISNLIVSVEKEKNNIPAEFLLKQNYPNPFNPTTNIEFQIPSTSFVTLEVYDILGRKVSTLLKQEKTAGKYNLSFDASYLSSGIYFYTLRTKDFIQTKKMILIR